MIRLCFLMHHSYASAFDEAQTPSVLRMSTFHTKEAIHYMSAWTSPNADFQLLDLDPALHFALLRLQLIELIKKATATPDGDIIPPILFAQTQLAPRAASNPDFLHDLEWTMALLIYPADKLTPPLIALLDPELKRGIAARVNEAILSSNGHRTQTRLKSLVKLKAWAEKRAREHKHDLPEKLSIWQDGAQVSRAGEDSAMSGTGEAGELAL